MRPTWAFVSPQWGNQLAKVGYFDIIFLVIRYVSYLAYNVGVKCGQGEDPELRQGRRGLEW